MSGSTEKAEERLAKKDPVLSQIEGFEKLGLPIGETMTYIARAQGESGQNLGQFEEYAGQGVGINVLLKTIKSESEKIANKIGHDKKIIWSVFKLEGVIVVKSKVNNEVTETLGSDIIIDLL